MKADEIKKNKKNLEKSILDNFVKEWFNDYDFLDLHIKQYGYEEDVFIKLIKQAIQEISKAKDKEFIEMIDNRINYLKKHQIDSEGSRIRLIIMELEDLKQKLEEK